MTVLGADTPIKPFETCSFLWGDRNFLLRRPVRLRVSSTELDAIRPDTEA